MTLADVNIAHVWSALGGPPLRGKRSLAFWRAGADGLSVSLDLEKNCFFDFVAGQGGGVLQLTELVLNCDRGAALRFLEANCGLDPRQLSREEKLLRARAARHVDRVAENAGDFARGLELTLRRHHEQVTALVIWLLENDIDPAALNLPRINSVIAYLARLSPRAVVRLYIDVGVNDAKLQGWLVARGRVDREDSEQLTHAVVELLAA